MVFRRSTRVLLSAGCRKLGVAGVGLMAWLLPGLAWAEEGGVPSVDITGLARVIVGLLVVLALIGGLMLALRRMGGVGGSANGQMRVLGALSVGQREKVVLVKVGSTQLLVGVAPGRVQTLHVLDEPLEGLEADAKRAAPDMQGSPFAERLRRVMQQHHHEKK